MASTLRNKRGLAYQCLECGKIDQRNRIKTHIYKDHIERGNVPYFCSLCGVFADTYSGLSAHLAHSVHVRNADKMEGPTTSVSFVNCAGDAAVYLQEGKHYAALTPDASEREWAKRTSRSASDPLADLIVIADGSEPVANLPEEFPDFEDLIEMDDRDVESTLLPPAPPMAATSHTATATVPQPPSPTSARATSPAPSSSSSASSVDPTVGLLKKLSDDVTTIKAFFQGMSDVLLSVNQTMAIQNKILTELHESLKHQSHRRRSRSRSPRRSPRKPSPRRYRR